jgi:glycosyltransferase 2 family protein
MNRWLVLGPRLRHWWYEVRRLADRRVVRLTLKLGFLLLSAAVLVWVLYQYRVTLLTYPWHIQPGLVLLAISIYYVDLMLAVWGWSRLLRRLSVRLPFREHLRIYALTQVAGRIPGAPWHIAGRAAAYAQHGVSKRLTGLAAGMELVLSAVSGLLCGLLIWAALPPAVQVPLWLLAAAIGLGLVVIHPRIISRLLVWLGKAEEGFKLTYSDNIIGLAQYGLVWIVGGVLLFCGLNIVQPISIGLLLSVVGIWSLSGGLSLIVQLSPSGFGIREITLSAMLSMLMSPALAVVVAIMMRVLLTATELLAALIASRFSAVSQHEHTVAAEETPISRLDAH